MGVSVRANQRVKVKEGEKFDKYLDLARELKRLRNMNVTVISTVDGTLGTITKKLKKRLDELNY